MTTELKRIPVKYIRDGIKANYTKQTYCQVCNSTEHLELHHYASVAFLYKKWCKERGYSMEDVIDHRDEFYAQFKYELLEYTVTLCKEHHRALHKIYGVEPKLSTSPKQERWVEKQRLKYGLVQVEVKS